MGYAIMGYKMADRRHQQRCSKDVSMHCSLLHGHADQIVTLRNFSVGGVYFESGRTIRPGTLIILRAMDAADRFHSEGSSPSAQYATSPSDPEACADYRSHTVARVQRCRQLDGQDDSPRYGVGAAIQFLTD